MNEHEDDNKDAVLEQLAEIRSNLFGIKLIHEKMLVEHKRRVSLLDELIREQKAQNREQKMQNRRVRRLLKKANEDDPDDWWKHGGEPPCS